MRQRDAMSGEWFAANGLQQMDRGECAAAIVCVMEATAFNEWQQRRMWQRESSSSDGTAVMGEEWAQRLLLSAPWWSCESRVAALLRRRVLHSSREYNLCDETAAIAAMKKVKSNCIDHYYSKLWKTF